MREVILYNKALTQELFNKYKEYICDLFLEIMRDLKIDCKLKVYIKPQEAIQESEDDFTSASFYSKRKDNVIDINDRCILDLENNNKSELYDNVFHELLHLYDKIHIMNNKYSNFDFMKKSFRKQEDFIIDYGYDFWTEFFAHSQCYYNFKGKGVYTFYEMVRIYQKLKVYRKEIRDNRTNSKYELEKKINNFKDELDYFVYFSAMHLAAFHAGRVRKYKYCAKISNSESFVELMYIYEEVYELLQKMNHGTYGKYMDKRLYNLGESILLNFYYPFSIFITRKNGYLRLGMFEKVK